MVCCIVGVLSPTCTIVIEVVLAIWQSWRVQLLLRLMILVRVVSSLMNIVGVLCIISLLVLAIIDLLLLLLMHLLLLLQSFFFISTQLESHDLLVVDLVS